MVEQIPDSLQGIKLTPEGKTPQEDMVLIRDPDEWDFCTDPVRRQILKILRNGIEDVVTSETFDQKSGERVIRQKIVTRNALSVVEIVKLSAEDDPANVLSKNQVYHHLPKMIEGGYIVKYGTITTGKRTTDYYRRTAKAFMCFPTPKQVDVKEYEEVMTNHLKGFNFGLSKQDQQKVVKLFIELELLRLKHSEKVTSAVIGDVIDRKKADAIDLFIWIYALTNPEVVKLLDEIRAYLPK